MAGEIEIRDDLVIPASELEFETSTSSGPGGQNVNKVETRVTLRFDLEGSDSLTDEQKERIRDELATRITKAGVLRVVCQAHRTQAANRKEAVERFRTLVDRALTPEAERKRTKVPRWAKRRRLRKKRRRGEIKKKRGKVDVPPDF